MTSLAHIPVVKKYRGATAVERVMLSDSTEAVAAGSDSVSWSFTFDPRLGDEPCFIILQQMGKNAFLSFLPLSPEALSQKSARLLFLADIPDTHPQQ